MKMKSLLLMLFVLLSIFSYSQSQNYSKVKIYANNETLAKLAELGLPVDHGTRKDNTFLITDFSDAEIQILRDNNIVFEILIEDVKAFYVSQAAHSLSTAKNVTCSNSAGSNLPVPPVNFETSPSSYAGMYRYAEMLSELDDMVALYPNLITVKAPISTFQTWEGRPIYHVKISDNPNTDETAETKVLYTAIHHAREPLSMSQTIFYMWYLLENYATNDEVKFLVDNTEMYFVPCINPDGYIQNETTDPNGGGLHRKNKRNVGTTNPGVDLNRNYSYGWNTTGVSSDPNSDVYPGTSAFSEPETQAIKWLVENKGFTSAFNAHTYGKLLLFPIGTTSSEFADHHDYFNEYSSHMSTFNGYLNQKSSGLYPASGDSDDYMYKVDIGVGQKDTIFAMTPEVGTAFWPAPSEVLPTCQEMVGPNMVLAHITHLYLTVRETDPSTIATPTGNFNHDVQRLGLVDGVITVSIDPLLNIQSVGADVPYNLTLKETATGSISYVLNPSIQFGDEVKYLLKTVYPTWTKRDTITKVYGSLPIQFQDDASNTVNWSGNWGTTTQEFYSPTTSFADSPFSNYTNNSYKTYEFVQTIDLSLSTSAQITYYAKWDIEADYDYCQFQVSTDGGASWQGQCGNYTVTGTSANGSVQPDGEPVYEGTQNNWVLEEINLSDYVGQVINVRFVFESDGGVNQDGFFFDDFTVSYNTDNSGLEENKMEIKMFPNPANDVVTISTSQILSSGELKVYNQAGEMVLNEKINTQTNQMKIDVSKLSQGFYTVQIISDGSVSIPVKLIVMH